MRKVMIALLAGLFAMSVGGVYAGEATKKSDTGAAKSEKGMDKKAAATDDDKKKKKAKAKKDEMKK